MKDMDSSSFAGGNVLEWNKMVVAWNTGSSVAPTQLPNSAFMRIGFHEMTLTGTTTPREFLRIPGHFHLYYWGYRWNSDVTTAGGKAAGMFD